MRGLAIVFICSVLTFLLRGMPFMLFGGKRQLPESIVYLGKMLPAAIMAVLVVYCIKDVDFSAGSRGIPELVSIGLVALLHLWRKNTLLSIGGGTVCYMILVQLVF